MVTTMAEREQYSGLFRHVDASSCSGWSENHAGVDIPSDTIGCKIEVHISLDEIFEDSLLPFAIDFFPLVGN